MKNVGDYMSSSVLTTNPGAFAHDAANEMFKNGVGALLVKENEEYIGIFTKMDWIHKALKWEGDPNGFTVSSIMSSPIILVERDDLLVRASLLMGENRVRHLGVIHEGQIVGIISVKDLERHYRELYGIEL
jgi:signal-transduction protein with cAMP-binding, CBS, and nucleotidyltransferase domain